MRLVIPSAGSTRRTLVTTASYLAGYGLLHGVASGLGTYAGVMPWFPAAGLSVAAAVLAGPRFFPALLVASTLANLLYPPHLGFGFALAVGCGHAFVYTLAGTWLRRWLDGAQIASVGDVAGVVLVSNLAPAFASLTGVATYVAAGVVPAADRWLAVLNWWVGDAIGVLVVTPFVLLHVGRAGDRPRTPRGGRPLAWWEFLGSGAGILSAGALTAWGAYSTDGAWHLDLGHLLVPPLIWIGLRRGLPGVVAGNAFASLAATALPALFGPPGAVTPNLQMLTLSLFTGAIFFGSAISAVRERSARRRLVMDTIQHGILEADIEGRITFVNPALRRLIGSPEGELVGRRIWDLSSTPDARRQVRADFENLCVRQPAPVPWISEATTGRSIRSDWNYQRDDAGTMTGVVCAITDITEQRRAERLAQAAQADLERQVQTRTAEWLDVQARFEAFMAASPAAAWIAVPQAETVYANAAFHREFGAGQAAGVLPGVPLGLRKHDDDVQRSGTPRQSMLTLAGSAAAPRDWFVLTFPVAAATRDTLIGGMAFDVTDMRRAEAALRDSEARFRFLAEHTTDVIARIDADATITYVSPAARSMFGLEPDTILGRRIGRGMATVDYIEIAPMLELLLRSGAPQRFTYRARSTSGRALWLETMSQPVTDPDTGAVMEVVTSTRDVTERKEAEEQLRQAERLASIGTLAAGIAHEINNPLGAIMLLAESALAAQHDHDAAGLIGALDEIRSHTLRAGRIVRSVLQFARREESRKWPGRLSDVVRRSRDLVRQSSVAHTVPIELVLPDGDDMVDMNPTEMEQVFVNLMRNAIEASPPGATVTVAVERGARHTLARVIDQGRGMTADERGRAFDPFFTTRQGEGGTGLGLSITHGIVHQHGGRIDVESAGGLGTTVTILLPLTASEEPHAAHPGG